MRYMRIIITLGMLLVATSVWALVVTDEGFENYASGSAVCGQGGWSGPFNQGAEPPDVGPVVITSPVSTGEKAARWRVPDGNGEYLTVDNAFPAQWTSGTATMYIDIGMNATDGPGFFSYYKLVDNRGTEATRIYLRRDSGVTGGIHLLGRVGGWEPSNTWVRPEIVTNPANNVYYKLKLVVDMTNRKYDCYVGDGDKSGVDVGHWGHYEGSTLVLDGVPAVKDLYFYFGATNLAGVTWQMYRSAGSFTGPAYALCDNIYIEGPDNAIGVKRTEIWVAKGTYNEKVNLRQYAHLYGGFAGTEISKEDRAGLSNPTIIDAGSTAPGNSAVTGASVSTVDGFTIRGGYYGVNTAGTSVNVVNNLITGNTGTGVFCPSGSPLIVNNTIIGNGIGVSCSTGSPQIANNIVSYNSFGIVNSGGAPVLSHNNVYANNPANYVGLAAGDGDISADSKFVNRTGGDYHLLYGSPCIDAGDPGVAAYFDREGAPRPVDGDGNGFAGVDMGAYESQFIPALKEVGELKLNGDEEILRCEEAVVTAAWPDSFYIESDDRTMGIRVDKQGHGLQANMRANVSGPVRTDINGERYIAAVAAVQNGMGSVEPLGLTGRWVGGSDLQYDPVTGSGQLGVLAYNSFEPASGRQPFEVPGVNNIGLLVRVWGRVTWIGGNTFYIDDGSGFDDGNPAIPGIKVLLPQGVTLPPDVEYLQVTGISSCYKEGGMMRRLIRVRTGDDIVPVR